MALVMHQAILLPKCDATKCTGEQPQQTKGQAQTIRQAEADLQKGRKTDTQAGK